MITKIPLLLLGHPAVSVLVLVCLALAISGWVQKCAGDSGVALGKRICWVLFLACLSLLLVDGVGVWYARKLNPDGYALIYPMAAALVLFPLVVGFALLGLVFKWRASKLGDNRPGEYR